MPPCKFFARGSCLYGASCRNSHDVPESSTPPNPVVLSPSQTQDSNVPECLPPAKASCWFFSQGKCKYGAACRNIHDVSPAGREHHSLAEHLTPGSLKSTWTSHRPFTPAGGVSSVIRQKEDEKLRAEAPSFSPGLAVAVEAGPRPFQQPVPCIFFTRGVCRRGQACKFLHEASDSVGPIQVSKNEEADQALLATTTLVSELSIASGFFRDIHGTLVSYTAGAEVSKVRLASDSSTIQITGLDADATVNFVSHLLSNLGHPIEETSVVFKSLGEVGSVAEVRVENSSFAKDVCRIWEQQKSETNKDIWMKPLNSISRDGTTGSRLQLSTVNCTWFQPSRVAWLTYDNEVKAENANDRLQENEIRDRAPDCLIQEDQDCYSRRRDRYYSLQVRNLHGQTTEQDLRLTLTDDLSPVNITLSEPPHDYSDSEAAEIVRGLLQGKGKLESFQHYSVPGSNKMRATATFVDRNTAAEAIRTLHNTKIEVLGKTKIFVNHVISIKYNVSTSIAAALKAELDKLAEDIWRNGHIHLKVYPQTDPSKSFTAARLFGESLRDVTGAKTRFEKLLAGDVVMKGQAPLWDSFLLKSKALAYLNELGSPHKIYIYRDARKSQLLMYGGSVSSKYQVQQALINKLEIINQLEHTIILTPQLLKEAMQGGMRRLKARFGEAATLNVARNPKTITITGSEEDFHQAQAILVDSSHTPASPSPAQLTEDCVVCWTEATDTLHTTCGHIYCTECFANQASSATECDIPLRCFGAEGTCKHIFSLDELKAMLSFSAFETLLQTSFDVYIRTHPKDFQYCPTPDCPQVYRLTSTGETFVCLTCLTPVCTTCNVISHDGMTCEEYKEMDSEDNKLFREYKKEHDVRDCPNCKVGIEKSEGCNHMECKNCGAHICWFCMKVFEVSRECYTHMDRAHGNIYDE